MRIKADQFTKELFHAGIQLDKEQLRAATAPVGPLIIAASPGSGKTTCLICRILFLLKVKKLPANELLAVTFSRKAAEELQTRLLESRIIHPLAASSLQIGTFHSVFLRILLQNTSSPVSVLQESEAKKLFSKAIALEGLSLSQERIDEWFRFVGVLKNNLFRSNVLQARSRRSRPFQRLFSRYEQLKEVRGVWDFDDILLQSHQLLTQFPAVRRQLQSQFRYVLVDEFQDTSPAQFSLLRLLTAPAGNVCVVGDDDQAIYSFRGACPDLLTEMVHRFPNVQTMTLGTNYRSVDPIIQVANRLIRNNAIRSDKGMVGTERSGQEPQYVRPASQLEEAEYVLQYVENCLVSGSPGDTCAILYRTHASASCFLECLRNNSSARSLINPTSMSTMTLHRAKGLEFDHVVLIGVTEGELPHHRTLNLRAASARERGIEEERRLLYVGITRARKTVLISSPVRRNGNRVNESRFIRELELNR